MDEEVDYGRIALIPKGDFAGDVQYDVGDVVAYNGSSYVAKSKPPIATLPTDTEYWQIASLRGEKGDKGETGGKGDKGEKGDKGDPGTGDNFIPGDNIFITDNEDGTKTISADINSTVINKTLLSTAWTGDTAPYTLAIELEGVTESTKVEGLESPDCTVEEIEAYCAANIRTGSTGAGTVTLKCFGERPSIDLPAVFIVRGD